MPREPAAWLATIARNECLTRIRLRMREPLPVEDAGDGGAGGGDLYAEALRRADVAALWSAISELAPQQRQALLLREFGGLSYDELGLALGVSVPAVESLLFRARAGLRRRLEPLVAGISGAGWLSTLQDAFARLGAAKVGSLPLAAKTATATLGLVAAAGGAAVVVEQHAARPHHAQAEQRAPATAGAAGETTTPAAAAVLPTAASQVAGVRGAGRGIHADRRDRGGGGDGRDRRRDHGGDLAPLLLGLDGFGHGGGDHPAATGDGSHDSGPTATGTRGPGSGDSGSGTSGSGSSGSGSSGSGTSGSGTSGSGDSASTTTTSVSGDGSRDGGGTTTGSDGGAATVTTSGDMLPTTTTSGSGSDG